VAAHLGGICRQTGRASDAIGRLGQAEFAIIAPDTEASGARQLVERLVSAVEANPIEIDGSRHPLQLRAGYAAVANFADASIAAEELVFRATNALRLARSDRQAGPIREFEPEAARGVW
jgi:diguanylate cyclase (GGDEF)-like protein